MTFYQVHFDDGTNTRMALNTMSTEEFRLANGGKSNKTLALEQAKQQFPKRNITKITRTATGETIWKLS
jgi:hypothetical protein